MSITVCKSCKRSCGVRWSGSGATRMRASSAACFAAAFGSSRQLDQFRRDRGIGPIAQAAAARPLGFADRYRRGPRERSSGAGAPPTRPSAGSNVRRSAALKLCTAVINGIARASESSIRPQMNMIAFSTASRAAFSALAQSTRPGICSPRPNWPRTDRAALRTRSSGSLAAARMAGAHRRHAAESTSIKATCSSGGALPSRAMRSADTPLAFSRVSPRCAAWPTSLSSAPSNSTNRAVSV